MDSKEKIAKLNLFLDLKEEIMKLERDYKHYKLLYLKYKLLCCSKNAESIKEKRDNAKDLLAVDRILIAKL